jgi:ubiquitin-activating enzyme E1
LQARLVGGRVIPAIVTTTAVVGGLMCLELYKLIQGKPRFDYKHAYFNLAVPLFAFAQPIQALEHTVICYPFQTNHSEPFDSSLVQIYFDWYK